MDILRRFGMQDCKSMSVPMTTNLTKLQDLASSSQSVHSTLYRQLIGSLMYLVHTRPDICYTMNALSQLMSDPKHIHLVAAKHVLRYVQGTITYGLRYTSSSGVLLSGYSDSDWAGSVVDRKSTCCPPISTRWQLHVHEDVHICTLEKSEDFSLL